MQSFKVNRQSERAKLYLKWLILLLLSKYELIFIHLKILILFGTYARLPGVIQCSTVGFHPDHTYSGALSNFVGRVKLSKMPSTDSLITFIFSRPLLSLLLIISTTDRNCVEIKTRKWFRIII